MSKKCKCPPPGAPEWVMTFGDMMSLLLTFFILLVSMSEIKKEDEFRAVVEAVQKAFGMKAGGGQANLKEDPALSLMKRLEELEMRQWKEPNTSQAQDPGIEGRRVTVTKVREGMIFAQGGRITFEPGSATLTADAAQRLQTVAELIRGYNNKIELRGHAASMELASDRTRYDDLWALSYARAKSVMDYLTSEEAGVRADRIRLTAVADREPLAKRVYSAQAQEPNRRVEIVVMEALVEDFVQPEMQ